MELAKLVSTNARAPSVGDLDGEGRGIVGPFRCKDVVHPVGGMDVFDAGLDTADLHRGGAVGERFVCAKVEGIVSHIGS